MKGSAAVACLLVREGADLYCKGNRDISPLDICPEEMKQHLIRYSRERYTNPHVSDFLIHLLSFSDNHLQIHLPWFSEEVSQTNTC